MLKVAHLGELGKFAGRVLKDIFRSPFAAAAFRNFEIFVVKPPNNKRPCRVVLLKIENESKRLRCKVSKPDIGKGTEVEISSPEKFRSRLEQEFGIQFP